MRRFRGWEPRTFYEYDGDRLVSSWTEPEWDDESRDLIRAEERLRALTGPNGEYLPDATADGADPNDYTTRYRYNAKGPFTNWAEKARLDKIDEYKKQVGEKANLNGLYWTVERFDY